MLGKCWDNGKIKWELLCNYGGYIAAIYRGYNPFLGTLRPDCTNIRKCVKVLKVS